jgi:putative membrane protein
MLERKRRQAVLPVNSSSKLQENRKRALKGADFDREYVSHEIAFRQAMIDPASKALIPKAQNAELKSVLKGAAPLLQGHLQHAQHLQQSLTGCRSIGP